MGRRANGGTVKIKRMTKREARSILRGKLESLMQLESVMQEKASGLAFAREQVRRERRALAEFMRTVRRLGAL